jgi:NTE family protein
MSDSSASSVSPGAGPGGSAGLPAAADCPALVLGGGGARAAYQAGVLRYLGEAFPDRPLPIVTGVGAGALTAAVLAGTPGSWPEATARAVRFWEALRPGRVFEPRSLWDLVGQLVRHAPSARQSLLDSAPLREALGEALPTGPDGRLTGIRDNGNGGWLQAVALTTTTYATADTVTWVDGADRPAAGRSTSDTEVRTAALGVDHVLAAASLALLFPAVELDGAWHGAGVGLRRPTQPAAAVGADGVLAVSARAGRQARDDQAGDGPGGDRRASAKYPSPLRIASILSNTLLLDSLDQDVAERPGPAVLLRPSADPTGLADRLNVDVGSELGAVLQYLHAEEDGLPDLLSLLCYTPEYLRRLLLLGYADAEARHPSLAAFLGAGKR